MRVTLERRADDCTVALHHQGLRLELQTAMMEQGEQDRQLNLRDPDQALDVMLPSSSEKGELSLDLLDEGSL